jgi:hypothetical protein
MIIIAKICEAIPVTGREDPKSCEMLRICRHDAPAALYSTVISFLSLVFMLEAE